MANLVVNSSGVSVSSGTLAVGTPSAAPYVPILKSMADIETLSECVQTSSSSLGITDTFTFTVWAKIETYVAWQVRGMLSVEDDSMANKNHIVLGCTAYGQADVWCEAYGNNAGRYQNTHSTPTSSDANWHHFALTWDGAASNFKTYQDGTLLSIRTQSSNSPAAGGFSDNSDRKIRLGCFKSVTPFVGTLYSAAIYDVELSQPSIAALYNGGDGYLFDVMNNSGNYQEALNCRSMYQCGNGSTPAEFGQDRGQDASRHCVSNDWTSAHLVDDYPGKP